MIMLRRLIWSSIIATLIMIPIGIGNYFLYPDASSIPESRRTIAQQLAVQQRNASFYTLTVIESLLAWSVAFQISSEFFRANPSKTSMMELHRRLTGINKEFYRTNANNIGNEAHKNASQLDSKTGSKGDDEKSNGE